MSDIIKKITDTITETGKNVGEKTKQVGNTAKLNAKIISAKRSISENYTLIGKYYYDTYKENPDEEIVFDSVFKDFLRDLENCFSCFN